jgi:RNA polymerase sigma-70 factor (ECF subfamily)
VEAPADLVAFVHRERPRLVRAADLLVGDRAVAEEIAQEALVRACAHWERVRNLSSPGGWVHRVTLNLATSQLRRWRLERRARTRLAREEIQAPPDSATTLAVRDALAGLPARQRRVLVLHHVLGWSAVEIADLDGATPEAVRQQLHRGREAMRARYVAADTREDASDVR